MTRLLALLAASLFATGAWAQDAKAPPFEQHFAPGENLERVDVGLIDGARATIDMAAYILTDRPVIAALARAARRGVRVRLYRQIDPFDESRSLAAALGALEAAGVEIRYHDPSAPLMHLKAYCLDGATLRFGAANFSLSGLTRQDNDLDIWRAPAACAAFNRTFERMWEEK